MLGAVRTVISRYICFQTGAEENHEEPRNNSGHFIRKCANTILMTLYLLLRMFDDKLEEAETADSDGHFVLLFGTEESDDKVPLAGNLTLRVDTGHDNKKCMTTQQPLLCE